MPQTQTDLNCRSNLNQLEPPGVVLFSKRDWSYLQRRYNITPRELEISQLLCRGLVNEEIAKSLNIKHGTVKTHIRNLYRKIWVRNKISMFLRFVGDTNNSLNKSGIDKQQSPI